MNLHSALEASEATAAQRYVLLRLADYADSKTGECWPTQRTLAKATGTSKNTVGAAIAYAASQGWLSREERSRQGTNVIYTYRFASELLPHGTSERDGEAMTVPLRGTARPSERDARYQPEGRGRHSEREQNLSVNPSEIHTEESLSDFAEELYLSEEGEQEWEPGVRYTASGKKATRSPRPKRQTSPRLAVEDEEEHDDRSKERRFRDLAIQKPPAVKEPSAKELIEMLGLPDRALKIYTLRELQDMAKRELCHGMSQLYE
jgi:hypothetical protein